MLIDTFLSLSLKANKAWHLKLEIYCCIPGRQKGKHPKEIVLIWTLKNEHLSQSWGWRFDLLDKSTGWSSIRPGFASPNSYSNSQPSVTPVPKDVTPSSCILGCYIHMLLKHMHRKKHLSMENKNENLNNVKSRDNPIIDRGMLDCFPVAQTQKLY